MKKLLIIFLFIAVSTNLFCQLKDFGVEKLIACGYYQEAFDEIQSQKKGLNSIDYAQMAVLAFKLNQYKTAQKLFLQVGDDHALTAEQKTVKFEVLRAVESYMPASKILPQSYGAKKEIISNFIDFPIHHVKINENIFIEKSEIQFGKTFMGLAFSDERVLITAEFGHNSTIQDLSNGSHSISNSVKQKKKLNYQANPTFFSETEYIYTKSILDYQIFKGKKHTENNVLNLYSYNEETKKEVELARFNSTNTNSVTPFYWQEERILFYAYSLAEEENYDVYYSHYNEGNWSKPTKLHKINTQFNEIYPFVHNGMLYFSSRGHENFGGLDLFSIPITIENGEIILDQKPTNLGRPFNSSFDDFALTYVSNNEGYFASNRAEEFGADELFKFTDSSVDYFRYNLKNIQNLYGKDMVINQYQTTKEGTKKLIKTLITNKEGEIIIPKENFKTSEFKIEVKKEGNLIFEQILENSTIRLATHFVSKVEEGDSTISQVKAGKTKGNGNPVKSIELEDQLPKKKKLSDQNEQLNSNVNIGDTVVFNNITFDLGSASLTQESCMVLNNLFDFLNNNLEIKVELSAHTDCEGSYWANMRLSKQRANSARNYLVKKGIDPARIDAKGYGEKYILNGCSKPGQCSTEANRINRRVEIIINKK